MPIILFLVRLMWDMKYHHPPGDTYQKKRGHRTQKEGDNASPVPPPSLVCPQESGTPVPGVFVGRPLVMSLIPCPLYC